MDLLAHGVGSQLTSVAHYADHVRESSGTYWDDLYDAAANSDVSIVAASGWDTGGLAYPHPQWCPANVGDSYLLQGPCPGLPEQSSWQLVETTEFARKAVSGGKGNRGREKRQQQQPRQVQASLRSHHPPDTCHTPEGAESSTVCGTLSQGSCSGRSRSGVLHDAQCMGGRLTARSEPAELTGPNYCKLLVPHHIAGAIIGKDGTMIGEIELLSRCQMQLSSTKTFFPGTTDRICIIGGEMNGLIDCITRVLDRLHKLSGNADRSLLAKIAVPSSAVSTIIGRQGEAVRRLSERTTCRINVSVRVPEIQERLVMISGDHDSLVKATIGIVSAVQSDPHLREHMQTSYDVKLPLGAWAGPRAQPADPSVPLMDPDSASKHTKRVLINYLLKAAPREILLRYSLLGSLKNAVKSKGMGELVDAIAETWFLRGGYPAEQDVMMLGCTEQDVDLNAHPDIDAAVKPSGPIVDASNHTRRRKTRNEVPVSSQIMPLPAGQVNTSQVSRMEATANDMEIASSCDTVNKANDIVAPPGLQQPMQGDVLQAIAQQWALARAAKGLPVNGPEQDSAQVGLADRERFFEETLSEQVIGARRSLNADPQAYMAHAGLELATPEVWPVYMPNSVAENSTSLRLRSSSPMGGARSGAECRKTSAFARLIDATVAQELATSGRGWDCNSANSVAAVRNAPQSSGHASTDNTDGNEIGKVGSVPLPSTSRNLAPQGVYPSEEDTSPRVHEYGDQSAAKASFPEKLMQSWSGSQTDSGAQVPPARTQNAELARTGSDVDLDQVAAPLENETNGGIEPNCSRSTPSQGVMGWAAQSFEFAAPVVATAADAVDTIFFALGMPRLGSSNQTAGSSVQTRVLKDLEATATSLWTSSWRKCGHAFS